jgi:hypothetical protein
MDGALRKCNVVNNHPVVVVRVHVEITLPIRYLYVRVTKDPTMSVCKLNHLSFAQTFQH